MAAKKSTKAAAKKLIEEQLNLKAKAEAEENPLQAVSLATGEDTKPALTQEKHRILALQMLSAGYTTRHIAKVLFTQHRISVSDLELLQLAIDFEQDIFEMREQVFKIETMRGLANTSIRLRRLEELAEDWEEKARSSDKNAMVYLKALEMIRQESETIKGILSDGLDDPWIELQKQLIQT